MKRTPAGALKAAYYIIIVLTMAVFMGLVTLCNWITIWLFHMRRLSFLETVICTLALFGVSGIRFLARMCIKKAGLELAGEHITLGHTKTAIELAHESKKYEIDRVH